jgi:hypothetical protein
MVLIISKTSGGFARVKLLPIVSLPPSFAIMSIGD